MKHQLKLCVQHLDDFVADMDLTKLDWEPGDSVEFEVTESKDCEVCRLAGEGQICTECGNDLVCEGYELCSECLEKTT